MANDLISRQAAIDLWEKYHPTIAVDAMQYDAELRQLPPAQPELIEKTAYIRGFEQGRTQGMIDSQGGKKMNKQRKVVITVTYNDLGVIVDAKAEELGSSAQPNLQPTCNQLATDCISRQEAINAMATWDWQELYLPIHFKQLLEELPTADVVEVVRCKDCKFSDYVFDSANCTCNKYYGISGLFNFCGDGERRTE